MHTGQILLQMDPNTQVPAQMPDLHVQPCNFVFNVGMQSVYVQMYEDLHLLKVVP